MYRTFGSGSNHKPFAYFNQQSKLVNKGRAIGLLRACDTRFASFFYAMHRALRCRKPLESTVHSAAWSDLKRPKPFIVRSADDVKNPVFWKQLFVLLRALFPLLKLLRLADSNEPNMDKVCFYVEQTRLHLVKSKDALMDEELFPTSVTISKETEEDANYEDDDEYATSDVEEEEDVTSHDGDYGIDEEEEDVFKVDISGVFW